MSPYPWITEKPDAAYFAMSDLAQEKETTTPEVSGDRNGTGQPPANPEATTATTNRPTTPFWNSLRRRSPGRLRALAGTCQ